MYYLITIFAPTASRSDLRIVAETITGVSHSSALAFDYAGTPARTPLFLSVTTAQLAYARACQAIYGFSLVIRDSRRLVIESDVTGITAGQTVRDNAISTVMAGTVTEGSVTMTVAASDDLTIFGHSINVPAAIPGVAAANEQTIRYYTGGVGGDVLVHGLEQITGTWSGAETKFTSIAGYGTCEFTTVGRIDNLGSNITFAPFWFANGADGGVSPNEEFGMEFGGVVSGDTCHHYRYYSDGSGSEQSVFNPGTKYILHHKVIWTPSRQYWETRDRDNALIASMERTSLVHTYSAARWRFNMWAYLATPTTLRRVGVVGFSYTAA